MNKNQIQILRFALAGLFCAVIEYISFYVLTYILHLNYLVANLLSILLAITINYFLSKAFVFEQSKFSRKTEFAAFMLFSGLGILFNQALLFLFVEMIHVDIRFSKGLAIGIVAVFNYITKKKIVFKN